MAVKSILRLGVIVLALAATACASRAQTGDDDTRADRTRRGIAGAAQQPLRDVGLVRPDIPDLLENMRYPYSTLSLAGGCPNVQYEIGQLDAIIGGENYQPSTRTRREQGMEAASNATVDAAENLAADAIPFRGWVRRLSGAQRADQRYARAIEMGQMRRAFLRGYGASLGCRAVLPAPPPGPATRPPDPSPRQANVGAPQ